MLLTHISDPLNKNDNARWFLKSFLPSPIGKISKENIKDCLIRTMGQNYKEGY